MSIRIFLLMTPFILPWWVVLILISAAMFYYQTYYEICIIGLLFDVLYYSNNTFLGLYGFSIASIILFGIVFQIKKRLLLY